MCRTNAGASAERDVSIRDERHTAVFPVPDREQTCNAPEERHGLLVGQMAPKEGWQADRHSEGWNLQGVQASLPICSRFRVL